MAGKFALLIGCGLYEDPRMSQLQVPVHDVAGLEEVLNAPEIGGFNNVDLLIDKPVDVIRRAIDNFFADKQPEDLLLLYFSGHGTLDRQGNLFLTASDTQKDRLRSTAIPSAFINEAMDGSPARRQLLILDCCYSGAFARGRKSALAATVIHDETFEGGYGRVVLTATNATQYAWEGDELVGDGTNSVFTAFLIEGLRDGLADADNDGNISVGDWYDYAYEQVVNESGDQSPHKWVYGQQGEEIIIARSRFTIPFGVQQSNHAHLDWPGRLTYRRAIQAAPHLPISYDDTLESILDVQENLLVEGDNLIALKSLQESHAGKIKCIYIDPPFNSSILPPDSSLSFHDANSPKNSHDAWLSFMYPRLVLLRELLREDGAIFVSIDDTNLPYLRLIMDEIFGSINHVSTFIWKKNLSLKNDSFSRISMDHEYILCYAHGSDFRLRGQPIDTSKYTNADNDPRGPWMSISLISNSTSSNKLKLFYPLENPNTGQPYYPPSSRTWRYTQSRMTQLISENRILWPKSSSGQPRLKRYLSEVQGQYRAVSSIIETPPGIEGKLELSTLIDHKDFVAAKPSTLIKTLIGQIPGNDFIVLDCFAGSGTTGQAVIDLNEEDEGTRSFILVEINHQIARQIAKERIERLLRTRTGQPQGRAFRYCTIEGGLQQPT